MSSALHTVRYPNGNTEFHVREQPPKIGELVTRNGQDWIVESVTEGDDGSFGVSLMPNEPPTDPRTSA